ncbi:MAG: hypothetical protein GY827_10425 [Cytophagales bacterium]|nr:hypothetical protein [Cytophagales bacterium]
MKKIIKYFVIALVSIFALTSCTEEDVVTDGTVVLKISNVADDAPLVLDKNYTNANGDQFSIENIKYYLSNVTLTNEDGTTYEVPDSYHLIDNISEDITLTDIPLGTYTDISFSIGVDAVANSSTAQPGDLDPSNEMAWNWDTGYKFFLLEGRYISKSDEEGTFTFHIGKNANYKTLKFTKTITIEENSTIEYNFEGDVQAVFSGPNTINLETTNSAHGETGGDIADNYASNFFTLK